jgi:hypothetical protein
MECFCTHGCKYLCVNTVRTYLLAGSRWTSLSKRRLAPSPKSSKRSLTLYVCVGGGGCEGVLGCEDVCVCGARVSGVVCGEEGQGKGEGNIN